MEPIPLHQSILPHCNRGSQSKAFADLLNPKWKGKIAWNSAPATSAASGFIGVVLTEMGEEKGMEYLRALSKQNITGVQVAARQVLDQVIAGEYSIALNIFNNHAVISAAKGAPSDWIAMNPAMAIPSVISVSKGAPHPNAGKLLVDFLASEDGQKLYREADYMPMDPAVPPRDPALRPDTGKFRARYFNPDELDVAQVKWQDLYLKMFR